MDLDNIKSNMVVKNYKEMCLILGEKTTDGNSKKAQLKEWERYFDYEKQGHKFIIKEIYATPLPQDFSDNDIYTKYVQVILMKHLKEQGSGEFTMKQLLQLCGFVNQYWDDMNLLTDYVDKEDITYQQAKYYYNQLYGHVYTYCTQAVTRCLDRLQKRGFLRWNKVLFIQRGKDIQEATIEEMEKYLDVTCKVKEEMGFKYLNVYNRNEYYKKISEYIAEYEWDNAFNFIRIVYAPSFIDKIIEESEKEYIESLLSVNMHCLDQMHRYIDTDIEKDIKKLADKLEDGDIEMARLCTDVDGIKKKKTDITDMFVEIKRNNRGENLGA